MGRTTGAIPKRWTADEDTVLLCGHDAGKTFAQIAAELPGRTRHMVAGRCWRLGLCEEKPKPDVPQGTLRYA